MTMSDTAVEPELLRIVERVDSVRRRLVIASLLRAAAIALGGALVFVVGYAWLDHHFHLETPMRMVALGLFVAGAIAGLVWLARALRQHIVLAHAARYIEDRSTYHQQLLASVEYYTEREHYPYSESLAQFMVGQVARQTAEADWGRLIPRWPQWIATAVVLLGVIATLWMAVSNGAYFSRYLTRLVQPTAAIAPLPATTLTLTSGDIVVAANRDFEIAATIEGETPETGTLTLNKVEENGADRDATPYKQIDLSPMKTESGDTQLALLTQLPLGEYRYRFDAGDATSATKTIAVRPLPELETLAARVTPPEALGMPAYDENVEAGVLNVIEGATVTLHLAATVPLKSGHAQTDAADPVMLQRATESALEHTFVADKPQTLAFSLTSTDGLTNEDVPTLAIVLSRDEAPVFEYTSPGSDYLATNVASIPLAMKVQDDFGLTRAALLIEVDGRPPERMPVDVAPESKEAVLQHVLELEDYNLEVGDTILVYAEAQDIRSPLKTDDGTTQSEVYFVEIRPYHQIYHQAQPSMGGGLNPALGLPGGERLPTLLQALEYIRALMKKTWSLQNAVPYDGEGRRKAESVATDMTFISDKLATLGQKLSGRITPEQSTDLKRVTELLGEAAPLVRNEQIDAAIPPTKEAYRLMRALVDELEKGEIPPGAGGSREFMEGIKLEEQVHLTRFEDEQVQWELDKLAEDIDSIREKQRELGRRFERFLMAQAEQDAKRQQITDEEQSVQENANAPGGGTPPPPGGGGGGAGSRMTLDGSLLPPQTQPRDEGASPEAMLEMLQAAQTALEERTEALEARLSQMAGQGGGSGASSGSGGSPEAAPALQGTPAARPDDPGQESNRAAAENAAKRLADARKAMADLKETARATYFQTRDAGDARNDAGESLDDIGNALDDASALVEGILNRNSRETAAAMLAAQAETAAEIARALEETTDPITQKRLQSELLELTATGHTGGSSYVGRFRGAGAPPLYVALVDSIVPPADKTNLPEFIDAEPRRAARYLADRFWSLAIDAKKERGALRETDASDALFSQSERRFYERAAQFEGDR